MTKTVRKAVTCTAVKKNGERCKQTRGLVGGLCASHRVAQPVGGVEEFKNILEEVINGGATASPGMKLEFIKGQWTEVPVEDVQAEVIRKSEELAKEEEAHAVVVIDAKYTIDEAVAILKQYAPLLVYVPESAVKDIREFAALVMDVVKMPYDELMKEFMSVTVQINEMELTQKRMMEDAKREYGDIPLDIKMDIDKLAEETFQLKSWKGLLLGTIEFTHEGMDTDDVQDAPVVDNKPSFFSKVKAFFGKRMKSITSALIIVGTLLMLLALFNNDAAPIEDKPKENAPTTVVDNGPANTEKVVPVVVDDTPVDNADKSIVPGPAVDTHVVQDGDTLWDIAEAEYGDGSMWVHIYDANADMLNADDDRNVDDPGHWIHAGQDLHIPTEDEIALNDH